MNPRRKQRLLVVSGILSALVVAVALILYSLTQNIDLFYTPSEVIHGKQPNNIKPEIGQRVRIGGMVVEGSVDRNPETLTVSFDLSDSGLKPGDPYLTVQYQGILPDLFREGQGIVAQGVMAEGNVLQAHEVLAKHDEEYMPPELAEKMKGIKHVKPSQMGAGQ